MGERVANAGQRDQGVGRQLINLRRDVVYHRSPTYKWGEKLHGEERQRKCVLDIRGNVKNPKHARKRRILAE